MSKITEKDCNKISICTGFKLLKLISLSISVAHGLCPPSKRSQHLQKQSLVEAVHVYIQTLTTAKIPILLYPAQVRISKKKKTMIVLQMRASQNKTTIKMLVKKSKCQTKKKSEKIISLNKIKYTFD